MTSIVSEASRPRRVASIGRAFLAGALSAGIFAAWPDPERARAADPQGSGSRGGRAIVKAPLPEGRAIEIARVVEMWRSENGEPDLGVAVVRDGEIAWIRGFGSDPDRRLPIGSLGNAMRAMIAAMLVEEGRFDWDDPVDAALEPFRLPVRSGRPGDRASWADVFTHRTGWVGVDRLLEAPSLDRRAVLRSNLARGEPWGELREEVLWSDGVFLAAEAAIGALEGTTFERVLRSRLLEPLGMDETTARTSTITDMAKWLRCLVARGAFPDGDVDGRVSASGRLVSERTFEELLRRRDEARAGLGVSLGFALDTWQGRELVIDAGSRASRGRLAWLPEARLGVVVLADGLPAPIGTSDIEGLLALLVGEWIEGLQPFVGRYVANFGLFRNDEFRVFTRDRKLWVDVPGETEYELEWPDGEGLWRYAITDRMAVSFERGDSGAVELMKLHADGVVLDLPRRGTHESGRFTLDRVAPLLGAYRSEEFVRDVRVFFDDGSLRADWPEWLVTDLVPVGEPQADIAAGRFRFRDVAAFEVAFERGPGGGVEALSLYESGELSVRVDRVSEETPPGLPAPADVLRIVGAAKRAEAWRSVGEVRILGTLRLPNAGLAGALRWHAIADAAHAFEVDYGSFGTLRRVGVEAGLHPAVLFGEWGSRYERVRSLRRETLDGRPALFVELGRAGIEPEAVAAVDERTGDVLLFESSVTRPFAGPSLWRFDDWRDVDGVRIPHRLRAASPEAGTIEIGLADVRTGDAAATAERDAPLLDVPTPPGLVASRVVTVDDRRYVLRQTSRVDGRLQVDRGPVLFLPMREALASVAFDLPLRDLSMVRHVARRGFRVLTIDPAMAGSFDEGALAALVEAVLDEAAEGPANRVTLVAAGPISSVAVAYAVTRPDRVDRVIVHDWPHASVVRADPSSLGRGGMLFARLAEEKTARDVEGELVVHRARRTRAVETLAPSEAGGIDEAGDASGGSMDRAAGREPGREPGRMTRPILETVGQWSYEVPPGSPLESVEEARRRGERRAPEEQRFAELRPRVKRRETFPAVGRLVFLSASAQPWRDAVVRFLEEPIEEDLAALEARAAEAWRESGGPPARLRFRLPDGRFGDSSDAGGSNGDEPFLAFAEVVAEALAREGRLDLDAEIAAGVTFRDRLTGNRPAPIGDDESTREGDGGTAPSSSDVSILDGFEAVFGTRTPEPSAFGEAPVVWRGHPARVGGAAEGDAVKGAPRVAMFDPRSGMLVAAERLAGPGSAGGAGGAGTAAGSGAASGSRDLAESLEAVRRALTRP